MQKKLNNFAIEAGTSILKQGTNDIHFAQWHFHLLFKVDKTEILGDVSKHLLHSHSDLAHPFVVGLHFWG